MEVFHSTCLTTLMSFTTLYVFFVDLIKDTWDMTFAFLLYMISVSLIISTEMLMHGLIEKRRVDMQIWRKASRSLLMLLFLVFMVANINGKMEKWLTLTISSIAFLFLMLVSFMERIDVALEILGHGPNYTSFPLWIILSQRAPFTIMHIFFTALANPNQWSLLGCILLSIDHHLLHMCSSKLLELNSRSNHQGVARKLWIAATYALLVVPAIVLTFYPIPPIPPIPISDSSDIGDQFLSKLPKIWHGVMSLLNLSTRRSGSHGGSGSHGRSGSEGRRGSDGRSGSEGRRGSDGRSGSEGRRGSDGRSSSVQTGGAVQM